MNYKFTLLLLLVAITTNVNAQTFNWQFQQIFEGENMQGMEKADDGSATLVGYGNTIMRSTDNGLTWVDPGIITNKDDFDYKVSVKDQVGYAVNETAFKAIDRKVNDNDLYADAIILKTIDGGATWNLIENANIGGNSVDTKNYSLQGNYAKKLYVIECINENVAYMAAYWKDYANRDAHSNVFKTTDGGENWEPLLDDLEGNSISSMVVFKGHIYVSGNKTLFKINISTDVVTDLYPVVDEDEDDKMYFWHTSIYNNTELIFPTTSDGIWVTADEGATFQALPNITKGYKVYKHNNNTYVVGGSNTATKYTRDGGTNWSDCPAGESLWNGDVIDGQLVGLGKNAIYKMAISDIEAGTFTWQKTEVANANGNLKSICKANDIIFLSGMGGTLLASTDGANTFDQLTLPEKKELIYHSTDIEFKGLAHGANGAGIITSRRHKIIDNPSGTDDVYMPGFIFITNDNWATYTVLDDTKIGSGAADVNPNADGCWGQDYYVAECIDENTFYVFVQWYENVAGAEKKNTHGRIFKTADAGANWSGVTDDLGSSFITNVVFKGITGYVGGNKVLLKTTDGGDNFVDLYSKLTALNGGDDNIYIQDINLFDANTLYVSTTSDGMYISKDAGSTFTKANINGSGCNATIVVDANSWMTIGTSSKTYYTNDAGSNWTNCYPGNTLFSRGAILGDYLFANAKSGLYKLPIADLDADTGTAIDDISNRNDLKIYLNSNELNIESNQVIEDCILYSITGKIVGQHKVNSYTHIINTSSLSRGIYIVRVVISGKVYTQKIQL